MFEFVLPWLIILFKVYTYFYGIGNGIFQICVVFYVVVLFVLKTNIFNQPWVKKKRHDFSNIISLQKSKFWHLIYAEKWLKYFYVFFVRNWLNNNYSLQLQGTTQI